MSLQVPLCTFTTEENLAGMPKHLACSLVFMDLSACLHNLVPCHFCQKSSNGRIVELVKYEKDQKIIIIDSSFSIVRNSRNYWPIHLGLLHPHHHDLSCVCRWHHQFPQCGHRHHLQVKTIKKY